MTRRATDLRAGDRVVIPQGTFTLAADPYLEAEYRDGPTYLEAPLREGGYLAFRPAAKVEVEA